MLFEPIAKIVLASVLSLAAAAAQAQVKAAAGSASMPLLVVDFNGKTVGRAGPPFQGYPVVYLTINAVPTAIPLAGDADSTLLHYWNVGTYFTNSDCTGAAYMSWTTWGVAPSVVIPLNGRNWLYTAASTKKSTGTVNAYMGQDGICTQWTGVVTQYASALPPIDVTTKFVLPFSIK
jgi:hypothetical protein